ncbi:23885_t:CDS:2 [Cetraspora pellucida]|uniref:23885_t:CDS:1 n=1 Tax=Cetraspora pellucida TaxID=1433469 RepID=A0A9N9FTU6_9GLOM|nr:23885_t:CDS:2 [Cetraspora pellucida]
MLLTESYKLVSSNPNLTLKYIISHKAIQKFCNIANLYIFGKMLPYAKAETCQMANWSHNIFGIFKKNGASPYPAELEKRYRISKNVLGVGSFAIVKECMDKETGESYALKIISKKVIKSMTQGKEDMLTTELDILKKIQHENLVKLRDLYETKDGVYIVTDLARGGELFNQLLLKGSYTEKDAASLVQQMLKGVEYLHEHGIVHRDLKPENLLFKDKLEDSILMITDFGLSKILTKNDDILMTACGTPGYVAPEVLLQKGYNKPVDLWSVGVITYTMLCGYPPFYGENQSMLLQSIMAGKYDYEEEDWCDISNDAKDLIDKLLCYDPLKRITAKDALQHNWFISAADVNLLDNVRKHFSPKDAFKRAVRLVQGVNRLQRLSKIKHQAGNDTIMQEHVVAESG